MKRLKQLVIGAVLALGFGILAAPSSSYAINVFEPCNTSSTAANSAVCADAGKAQSNDFINTIVNTLLYILGAIAVIMIIVGGIMYVTSGGDAGNVKKAKDTILYSVIGLIVAILAFTIINFVVAAFI